MAKLIVVSDEPAGCEFIIKDQVTLGRSDECDLTLPGASVSRVHARVRSGDDAYSIEDLGSANGTRLNGRPIQHALLRDGDWISVGECKLTFVMDDRFTAPRAASLMDSGMPTVVGSVGLDRTLTGPGLEGVSGTERLRQHLHAVQKIAQASCGALDIQDLLRLILHQLLSVFPQAEHAHVVLRDMGEDESDLCLSAGVGEENNAGMSKTLLEMVTEKREAVLASNVSSHGSLRDAQSILASNLRSIMCCPLAVGSTVRGAVQVDTTSTGTPFGEEDLRLLATIAGQAAVAAENARMHGTIVKQQRLAATGQAVSSIAHCMKNVLNGLRGGSYILDLGIEKDRPEQVTQGWEMVRRNIDFISELAQDMLAYCGKRHLSRRPTDIPEMLRETIRMVRDQAAQAGIEIALEAVEGQPPCRVDRTALKRVVLNLLSNAIDACSEGDRVQVRARADGDSAELSIAVEDDGPGMPPEVRDRLFEPFFTTKGHRGTGLGLALVKKVVEEHGGRVEIETQPNQGTRFQLVVPLTSAQPETEFA